MTDKQTYQYKQRGTTLHDYKALAADLAAIDSRIREIEGERVAIRADTATRLRDLALELHAAKARARRLRSIVHYALTESDDDVGAMLDAVLPPPETP